jgi:GDP-L-fucose synthase
MSLLDKRIIVTGGEGFLGRHVTEQLKCKEMSVIRHSEYELLNDDDVIRMYCDYAPDIVIHLAARVGGIQYNKKNPGKLFYENLKMGLNMIHYGMQHKIEKFVCVGTICSYPKIPPRIPFKEEDLWEGYPEETNAGYGIAKKALLVQCQTYRQQYDMNCIYLMPVNMYGEYDDFKDESSHVIPALIKRFIDAKDRNLSEIIIWGSGKATREFLYVGDCAKYIITATDVYDLSEPVNIGSGSETSIFDLARMIASVVGYTGTIIFDSSMPDGQPRRVLNINRMRKELGDFPFLSLKEGLRRTVSWYQRVYGKEK